MPSTRCVYIGPHMCGLALMCIQADKCEFAIGLEVILVCVITGNVLFNDTSQIGYEICNNINDPQVINFPISHFSLYQTLI